MPLHACMEYPTLATCCMSNSCVADSRHNTCFLLRYEQKKLLYQFLGCLQSNKEDSFAVGWSYSFKHPNARARVVRWTWSPTFYLKLNYVDEETAGAPTPDPSSSFATASILRTIVEILYPINNPKYVHAKVEHMQIAHSGTSPTVVLQL